VCKGIVVEQVKAGPHFNGGKMLLLWTLLNSGVSLLLQSSIVAGDHQSTKYTLEPWVKVLSNDHEMTSIM